MPAVAETPTLDTVRLRRAFPGLEGQCYLNAAGLGPCSLPAQTAFLHWNHLVANTGGDNPEDFPRLHMATQTARGQVARFLGARTDEIAFFGNATDGADLVLHGLDWRAGDEVITSTEEHPALTESLASVRERFDLRVAHIPLHADPNALLDAVEGARTERTRLVAISWVGHRTGVRIDMAAVCRWAADHGILSLTDSAQVAGHIAADLHALGTDFSYGSGHKWCFGPLGTGWLYVRRDRLDGLKRSWTGAESGLLSFGDDVEHARALGGAARLEFGTRPWPLYIGFGAAVEFLSGIGMPAIDAHGCARSAQLADLLRGVPGLEAVSPGGSAATSILSCRLTRHDPKAVGERLWREHRVAVRMLEDGLRFSLACFVTPEQVEHTGRAVQAVCGGR